MPSKKSVTSSPHVPTKPDAIETVPGAAHCLPGKPCGLLALVLDQTEKLSKRGVGLSTFVRLVSKPPPGAILSGVLYKPARKGRGFVINHCPWCGQDPSTREPEARAHVAEPRPKRTSTKRRTR